MGRFERENISKKVNVVSQVFAILASLGILIIGLQLFSKTTGFDIFDINYSLSKLFSDEPKEESYSPEELTKTTSPVSKPLIVITENSEALKKAESLLQNYLTISPINSSPSLISPNKEKEKRTEKFSLITIASLLNSNDLFTPIIKSVYSKNITQFGVFPKVKDVKFSRWSLGLSLSPSISYRKLKYTNLNEIIGRQVGYFQSQNDRNHLDKALMKYSLGLDLIFRFNKKLSFQSGLTYYNTGESLLLKEMMTEPKGPTSLAGTGAQNHYFFEGTADFASPEELKSDNNVRFANNLSYWEIPLIVNYQIKTINELTDLEIQAGASFTRLDYVNAMVYNFDNDGYYLISGSNPNVFQKYGSNAIIGIIYNKYITNTIQLFANPQVKVGLTNIFNPDYTIKQHYYNAGVRLGMKINL